MLFKNLSAWWWNYVYLTGGIAKLDLKGKTSRNQPALPQRKDNARLLTAVLT
jgi:hypothetical protein